MTHIGNIPHMLQWGVTHYKSPKANPHFIPIGDVALINARNSKQVFVNNGDHTMVSPPSILLGDFEISVADVERWLGKSRAIQWTMRVWSS